MKWCFILVLWCVIPGLTCFLSGQNTKIFNDRIKTVELRVNDGQRGHLPVLRLGSSDVLHISFDELSHDYHRYTYKIEHLDSKFQPEEGLFESDYVQSTADQGLIEDYVHSMNTSVLYTHYRLSLPNRYMRPILSGNYALTVYDEDEAGEPVTVLKTYFYVAEEIANIVTTATTDTDIDRNDSHQQLNVSLQWQNLIVRDADSEIKLVVLQNNSWNNATIAPRATGHSAYGLKWEHAKGLIFEAGNEYRKFEVQSTRYPGLHIDKVGFFDPYYHVTLMTDSPKHNYLYDEDQNGRFVPLANSGSDADAEADYIWVHFSLEKPEHLEDDQKVYVNGLWSNECFSPSYEMTYRENDDLYETAILLKQGYYSYRYLTADAQGHISSAPIEGNFFQTENEYTFLVYYNQTGGRYERLIGWRTASYKPQ